MSTSSCHIFLHSVSEHHCEFVAALCGSLGCVTLHVVGFSVEPVTIMPHARASPNEHDQLGTRFMVDH